MPYRITFTPRAERDLEALPKVEQERIARRIDALSAEPRPAGAKKLKGEGGFFRLRVADYRIIYTIHDRVVTVAIIRIGHRRDIYR